MLTSSAISVFGTQTGKNTSRFFCSNFTIDFENVNDDFLIALRKGKRTCISCPISDFLSYSYLSLSFHIFISSLDSYFIPKSISEALCIPGWRDAMKEEMLALGQNGT